MITTLSIAALLTRRHVAELRPTMYVSETGNDSNNGRSEGAAKRTLASAIAASAAGERIGIIGGVWREACDVSSIPNCTVMRWGAGIPRITGADIINPGSWTNVGGSYPHVWQAVINHDGNGSNRIRVYQAVDGVEQQLLGVTSLAACEANPGSFVRFYGSAGSPATLYIHAPGSADPTDDAGGSIQYTVAARTHGIAGGANTKIIGPLHTDSCISNNGSCDLVSYPGGVIRRVLAVFGSKHNLGTGDGLVEDCGCHLADDVTTEEPSNTSFVAYLENGAGRSVMFRRCGVTGYCPGVNNYAHGNPTGHDKVEEEQCWAIDTQAFVGSNASQIGCYFSGVNAPPGSLGTMRLMMYRHLHGSGLQVSPGTYGPATYEDCVFVIRRRDSGNYNPVFMTNQANPVVFSRCTLFMDTATGIQTNFFANSSSSQNLTVNHCLILWGVNLLEKGPSGAAYVGNNNIFLSLNVYNEADEVNFQAPSGYIRTLAGWQTETGQDGNSVVARRADQTPGNPYALFKGVQTGANNGPLDGDFRLNANARVYTASGVERIGTFADGTTPLTLCGPQSRWDWNQRKEVPGPPQQWPVPPQSVADWLTYIANPGGWSFYPAP